MNQQEIMNRLRSLYNIDGDQLPELDESQWAMFSRDPVRYLIRASAEHADAIWREIEKRQTRR